MGGDRVPWLGIRAVAINPSTRAVEGGGMWKVEVERVEGDGMWLGSVHGVHGQECRYLPDVWQIQVPTTKPSHSAANFSEPL